MMLQVSGFGQEKLVGPCLASSFFLFLCLASLSLSACAPEPEKSKALVKISNVKVWRSDDQTLKVFLDCNLEMGVRLPLPYKEILAPPQLSEEVSG